MAMGNISLFECVRCASGFKADLLRTVCECGAPVYARYDLPGLRSRWNIKDLARESSGLWRYHPVLPTDEGDCVTLGEGGTPLIRTTFLGKAIKAGSLWLKDESRNPTGSCEARGASVVVTMAKRLGIRKITAAAGGDGESALAAYAAAAGIEARIVLPNDVPQSSFLECKAYRAVVELADKPQALCGEQIWDVSPFREPFRIEGQKTAGYELAEQFGWEPPDAILCPCGDGLALAGIWKAFGELQSLGWIESKKPKMIAVQATGRAATNPAGDFLVLNAIRESGGTAIAISAEKMLDDALLLAESEGIFGAPETGACIAAARHLLTTGFLNPAERIVLYNVASGLRRIETFSTRFLRRGASEQDKLGGLILPR